ncbi:hypothetical protein LSTR_LSTR003027 [Laodelphax striatellus]|uniref:Carboxylic ester hydrolase n=1 Tax=Laodelphax striatellus TaxID=195883 RepID=A0A482XXD1_LAOST|nr:hypothetical protein LSTR_LSTR003027 [Laodelphax striatellus]
MASTGFSFAGCFVFFFFLFLSTFSAQKGTTADAAPEVILPQGRLQGTLLKTKSSKLFEGFLGIPYAIPPVGDLRFKIAQPAKPWKGVFNASTYGSVCLQFTHIGYQVVGSEDCLFINVFRPQKHKLGDELLDVIVHIHGGAFQFLSGDFFKPTFLMDDDNHIIYVNFNYRLGPLGFMSTGDKVLPGNLGLKDQVAALKWIRDNIRQFGGNPDSVTIEGISAGGVSVHYHYLSPLSRGLFHRGLSGSGAVLNPWALVESVPQKTRKLAAFLGCPTANSAELVACLETRPAEMIVKQVPQFMLVGDRLFGAGITQAALMQGLATGGGEEGAVYVYRFGYRGAHSVSEKFSHSDEDFGVAHADENLYVLETDFMDPTSTAEDLNMQRHMINMWKTFAKTGVPEFPIGFTLPKVQDGLPKLMYLEIRSADNAKAEISDDLAHRSFWASLPLRERLRLPAQQQKDEL